MRSKISACVRLVLIIIALMSVSIIVGFIDEAHSDKWCGDYPGVCQPQCVSWARQHSKVKLCGNARDWPTRASRDRNYVITSTPKKNAVMILDYSQYGHAVAIQDSDKKKGGKYSLKITHSNYDLKCNKESGVKATYDKDSKKIKFKEGALKNKELRVIAIIKRK